MFIEALKAYCLNLDWKFIVGDIIVPFFLFIARFIFREHKERHKLSENTNIYGNNNTVIQNCDIVGGEYFLQNCQYERLKHIIENIADQICATLK